MYDKDKIKEELTLDEIKMLLIELGAQNIETYINKGYVATNTICHNISDGKIKLYYYIEERSFHCYTACDCSFDIYDLIIRNHKLKNVELKLYGAIQWILKTLGKQVNAIKQAGFGQVETKGRRPELDWLDRIVAKKPVELKLNYHLDGILNLFSRKPHPAFLEDGISEETLRKFEVCYYEKENRIVIPHRHHDNGKIIGLKSRSLNFEDIDRGYKYIPLKIQDIQYNFPVYSSLYGLWQNKENIKKYKKVILFEAEKSVQQCETFFPNGNYAVALSGSNVSKYQLEIILSLGVEEVIVALDRMFTKTGTKEADLYYEKLLRICNMFAPYVKVSIVWDTQGLTGFKASPSDAGKDIFLELLNKRIIIKSKE